MFEKIAVMNTAQLMAQHAAKRQSVIATNIANADTPRYQARDVQAFDTAYAERAQMRGQKATRDGHLNGRETMPTAQMAKSSQSYVESPNGNSVSLETEMMKAAETRQQHEMSVAIYKSAIDILRLSVGRR